MATGDIHPIEGKPRQNDQDDDGPMFPHISRGAGDQQPKGNDGQDKEEPNPEGQANTEGNANPKGQANPEGEEEPQVEQTILP